MTDNVTVDGTRASVKIQTAIPPSSTRTIDELVEEAGHLRNVARVIGDDVAEESRKIGEFHHHAFEAQLNARTREVAKRSAVDMLDELATRGFAWRDIARLIGVSVPAVRRWRQGESPTGPRLWTIARLLAFIDTLRADHHVTDAGAWLEMPLVPSAPITGIDMIADGHYAEVFDLAAEHTTAEDVLDQYQPDWRERYRSDIEVFEAPDGELGIRFSTRDEG